jgi:hypothetical protein
LTVHTLSRWVDRLLGGKKVIECPHMELLGRDHEPPVFTGPGHITINPDTRMRFVMHATPRDSSDAFKKIIQAQQHPYDYRHQFRVNTVGYDGTEWSGGWTSVTLGEVTDNVWRLSGPIRSLHTGAEGFGVAEDSSVELVYDRELRLPIPMNMVGTVVRDGKQVLESRSAGSKIVKVLDVEIEFFRDAEREHLWAVARTSPNFPHPHLENWVSEPLNMLLGEIVTPRLVARNFGGGRAFITLHEASGRPADSLVATILREDPLGSGDGLWSLYKDILTLVATARDADGGRNFEAHPLTRFYWEIIQATKGSNWVLCMTLASVVEGLTKLTYPMAPQEANWPEADVRSLRETIESWKGNDDLRSSVLNYFSRRTTKGLAGVLRSLAREGVISKPQTKAWETLRNSSMHGEMVVPWSDQEQDAQINHLVELTHRMAKLYIESELGKVASTPPRSDMPNA